MYTDRQVPVTFCDSVYAYYIYIYLYLQTGRFLFDKLLSYTENIIPSNIYRCVFKNMIRLPGQQWWPRICQTWWAWFHRESSTMRELPSRMHLTPFPTNPRCLWTWKITSHKIPDGPCCHFVAQIFGFAWPPTKRDLAWHSRSWLLASACGLRDRFKVGIWNLKSSWAE